MSKSLARSSAGWCFAYAAAINLYWCIDQILYIDCVAGLALLILGMYFNYGMFAAGGAGLNALFMVYVTGRDLMQAGQSGTVAYMVFILIPDLIQLVAYILLAVASLKRTAALTLGSVAGCLMIIECALYIAAYFMGMSEFGSLSLVCLCLLLTAGGSVLMGKGFARRKKTKARSETEAPETSEPEEP